MVGTVRGKEEVSFFFNTFLFLNFFLAKTGRAGRYIWG